MSTDIHHDPFQINSDGIHIPRTPVDHRDDEYNPAGFDILRDMQQRHFWYRGRHRFLLRALQDQIRRMPREGGLSGIDLGGGCGGWLRYLDDHRPDAFTELALADSSLKAMEMAGPIVGPRVGRYQIDLLNLGWNERWDVAFLLDVLEHIPADLAALRQIWQSLRPGGLLLMTVPALKFFWSYNDEMASHVRRYSRDDLHRLAADAGFEVCTTRYFMFFLSPLLLLSRLKRVDCATLSQEQIRDIGHHTHRTPPMLLNRLLQWIFALETPLGYWIPFPWGTSVLGVFRKPPVPRKS